VSPSAPRSADMGNLLEGISGGVEAGAEVFYCLEHVVSGHIVCDEWMGQLVEQAARVLEVSFGGWMNVWVVDVQYSFAYDGR
jgi:hypothetical protein